MSGATVTYSLDEFEKLDKEELQNLLKSIQEGSQMANQNDEELRQTIKQNSVQ